MFVVCLNAGIWIVGGGCCVVDALDRWWYKVQPRGWFLCDDRDPCGGHHMGDCCAAGSRENVA